MEMNTINVWWRFHSRWDFRPFSFNLC